MKWAELLQIRTANGLSPKGLQLYDAWLRGRVRDGVTIDRIARELLPATGGSFDNPAVSYFQTETTPQQIAENVAQVFLGTRIQCAQCHNHPFDRWTLDDYYGFAAFFSRIGYKQGQDPRELMVFDAGAGEVKHPIAGRNGAPGIPRRPRGRAEAGRRLSPGGGRLARLAREPGVRPQPGELRLGPLLRPGDRRAGRRFPREQPAQQPRAARRAGQTAGRIRATTSSRSIRDILRSRTYQLSTRRTDSNRWDERNFSHQKVRRMRAEVLLDCISEVTRDLGQLPRPPPGRPRRADSRREGAELLPDDVRPLEPRDRLLVRGEDDADALAGTPPDQRRDDHGQDRRGEGRGAASRRDGPAARRGRSPLRALPVARADRRPRPSGSARSSPAAPDKVKALQDLFWALLNSNEFLFNH